MPRRNIRILEAGADATVFGSSDSSHPRPHSLCHSLAHLIAPCLLSAKPSLVILDLTQLVASGLPTRIPMTTDLIVRFSFGGKHVSTSPVPYHPQGQADLSSVAEEGPTAMHGISVAWETISLELSLQPSDLPNVLFERRRCRVSLLAVRPAAFGTTKTEQRTLAHHDLDISTIAASCMPREGARRKLSQTEFTLPLLVRRTSAQLSFVANVSVCDTHTLFGDIPENLVDEASSTSPRGDRELQTAPQISAASL